VNNCLTELDLSQEIILDLVFDRDQYLLPGRNDLTSAGAGAIVEALNVNQALRSLNLSEPSRCFNLLTAY
jgi:hypothetical protein